ncbi:MAG: rod shape-determining protein MreD [Acutalibacteraceae bacterium]
MNFSDKKQLHLRYAIYVILAVLTAAIQHTPRFRVEIFGLAPMLLVPLTVAVAMQERSTVGLFFGALTGVLWDFASSGADGMYTLLLSTIGFFIGVLVSFIIRNNIISAVILNLCACFAVSIAYWGVFIFRKGYEGMYELLFGYYLPCAFVTSLFIFLYYYLISSFIKSTSVKKIYIK